VKTLLNTLYYKDEVDDFAGGDDKEELALDAFRHVLIW
jgi:hypothetical protein